MSKKKKVQAAVLSQQMIAPAVYDLWIETELAKEARAGQFLGIYPADRSHLLPRPISICQVDRQKGAIRLVYRIAGEGTREFSGWQMGQRVEVLGVLGNGFPVEECRNKRVFLLGGGIGIPPMLELAKELKEQDTLPIIIVGYRDNHLFLMEDLERYGEKVLTATEDGSAGVKGNVMDVLRQKKLKPEVLMACGPMPMLRAIKDYARQEGAKAYISLEERMACGVGACLGCVCRTTQKDRHSHVNNARICTDGPVFDAQEVEI
ncbi:MAG: dihydroorotate dehydrogenase electron transfer subunit [Lachnospiraceae bacterium]|nr:dihydroorotate dehydrogenase electron transfer subunit [Lachnospiraceae bacterium]